MKEKKRYETPKADWLLLSSEEILFGSNEYGDQLIPSDSGDGDNWDW